MTPQLWQAQAISLATNQRARAYARIEDDGPDQVGKSLVELHELMVSAPLAVLEVFRDFPEPQLADGASRQIERLAQGNENWFPSGNATLQDWVLAVASQIRALDLFLAHSPDLGHGPQNAAVRRRLAGPAYIVPRIPPVAKRGEPYSRRGVLHHHIVPATVLGLTVRVHTITALPLDTGPPGSPKFGAAMFAGNWAWHRWKDDREGKMFLAQNYHVNGLSDRLAEQVRGAFADQCLAAVWPELTMTPEACAQLREAILSEAAGSHASAPLRLVLAGSWHDLEDGNYFNQAHILDRYGRPVGSHRKFKLFANEKEGREAVTPGDEIAVVSAGDTLFGIGICKDFCDDAVDNPFCNLPLDHILVASLGDEPTLIGHKSNALRARLHTGCGVFIVQQHLEAKTKSLGTVFFLTQGGASNESTQESVWEVHSVTKPSRSTVSPSQ